MISENIARIRERIVGAAKRVGRDPAEIELMAVTKTVAPGRIREAHDAGLRLFGENRVQEFEAKHCDVRALSGARWHMIGHVQRNKAARAVALFDSVESVDSWRLASALNEHAANPEEVECPPDRPRTAGPTSAMVVLIEINVGGEEQKSGLAPDSEDLRELLERAAELPNLQIQGLMTVPPFTEDPEGARPYFRRLRELRDEIAARNLPGVSMDVLSMGMSHDFEIAIEEGASRVRIGSALFGERPS